MSSTLITHGAPLQSWHPLMMPRPDHAQGCHHVHIHDLRRCLKRCLAPLGPLALAIDGNAVVAAERTDPRLGPANARPVGLPARLGAARSAGRA